MKASHSATKRAAFWDAGMSSVPARASGWLATMPTGRPSIGRERGDDVGRPALAHLEQAVVVDDRRGDLAHVVAAGRDRRDQLAGLRARAVGRVVARPAGRLVVDAVGEVGEQLADGIDGGVTRRHDERRHAGVASQLAGAAELGRR